MNYRAGKPLIRLFGGSLGLGENRSAKTRLKEWLLNNRFLPAFELTPHNVDRYVAIINQAKGGVLVGYASATFNLAEFMCRAGFKGSPLASVICTAEYMPEDWKQRVTEVLGVPVFCYYGCGEVTGIAHECSGEEGYIIAQEHVIVEVANGKPAAFEDQGSGQACITTLFNYAMPLIRYLNGDMLQLGYSDNGHSHLRIMGLQGRVMDQLFRTDGTRISAALPPHIVYKSGVPVWKYQVVQTALDEIAFHYLLRGRDVLTNEMKHTLTHVFKTHLGQNLGIEFVAGRFELSKSGKHRLVINRCIEQADPQLNAASPKLYSPPELGMN
jgi:phenylacetate-CoA ligase